MNFNTTIIDERAALEALDGNRQLLCELAQICIEDAPVLILEMEAAIVKEQVDTARRMVHSLKGISSTFFAKSVTELARRLEEEVSEGTVDPLRNGGAEELKRSIQRLLEELQLCGLASQQRS